MNRGKGKDTVRLAFASIKNFDPRHFKNEKAAWIKDCIKKHEIDGVGGAEAGINCWEVMPRPGRLSNLLRATEDMRSVAAFNWHETLNIKQWGGTFMCTYGRLAGRTTETGTDTSGLGRWCWMKFRGKNNITTRIIAVCVPRRGEGLTTVFGQQQRCFETTGETRITKQ